MRDIFETLDFLKEQIKPCAKFEKINLTKALGRILYEDIFVLKNLPSFDNSALDGYALNYADKNELLDTKGSILAGDKHEYSIEKNECYKIMTGAKIPQNANTILMFEDALLENGKLNAKNAKENNAIRFKGEEAKIGELLFKKGQKITQAMIAMLAAQGIYELNVLKKARVGIFSSGDELVEPWEKADEYSIYNANAFGIYAILQDFADVEYLGLIKDDLNAYKKILNTSDFDVLISSGGASMGEADFIRQALLESGFSPIFEKVNAKLCKHVKVFNKNNTLFLALPGNPLASLISTHIFAKNILNLFYGLDLLEFLEVKLASDLNFKGGRNDFVFGKISQESFIPNKAKFGSGMIKPLYENTHILITKIDEIKLVKDQEVKVLKI
ncbi:molybdopterin molybdotransferase MoeA [Campylobacter lari]|uniref:molybdopterin molybdotransferase MoeA n=1 Tax=Campylobacter lari TaxID=201 RepID=UPI00126BD226|nr:molybdopterin molybdotransferase MoeA [Campylobacter lari]EAH6293069.1 molybdopterin molybdenumtransferase MoeA [Campylobacter lari]EAI6154865.1 molybdopterin molybdotransferase MoeA [Campylobacter lari]EAI7870171.1 molybdopterin molybdotransferase MoeA [Campylobacter lari]EAI8652851.1 molybdopterin molybdotransferase MoeA [Campylobacter lari]EAJ5702641.1 molybdopterin molybdotransferase MoeA [Campylobacter lari]